MVADNAKTKSEAEAEGFHNGGGPLFVPGFGHAVDFGLPVDKHWRTHSGMGDLQIEYDRFRHGVNDFQNERLVVREIAMLALMDAITEKPRWHEKIFDEAIVERWRAEAIAMPLISKLAWEWCLRELRDKTEFLVKHGFITTFETGSVCAKADGMIDADLRDELLAAVKPLLDVEESAKDWHPNSDEQVLNLVHPSLFPLVYGRTHVLPEGLVGLSDCLESCGKGTVVPEPTLGPQKPPHNWYAVTSEMVRFSRRFQWLPAEVKFTGSGNDVEFNSYINNLHPVQHKGLYSVISKVMSKAIPMWNEVLVRGEGRVPARIRTWVCLGDHAIWGQN
jgi:hypothetical protein